MILVAVDVHSVSNILLLRKLVISGSRCFFVGETYSSNSRRFWAWIVGHASPLVCRSSLAQRRSVTGADRLCRRRPLACLVDFVSQIVVCLRGSYFARSKPTNFGSYSDLGMTLVWASQVSTMYIIPSGYGNLRC